MNYVKVDPQENTDTPKSYHKRFGIENKLKTIGFLLVDQLIVTSSIYFIAFYLQTFNIYHDFQIHFLIFRAETVRCRQYWSRGESSGRR